MEGFLIYIGKSALATAAFYLVYLLLFQNKKQFVFNRIYLPLSMLLSFGIPLITFTRIEYVEAIVQPSTLNLANLAYLIQEPENMGQFQQVFEWYHYVFGLYILVIAGFLVHLSLGYFKAHSIVKKSDKKTLFETLVHISFKDVHPFSFFKKIVISNRTINDPNLRMIISHEKIHVEESHTLDILLSEVLFMFQWFNPFAWLIKDAIKNNLEYKTDAQIIKHHDPKAYQLAMLSLADKKGVAPFLNALNGSQLKNRIIMMKQKTENKYAIVKQLLVLPILAMLVMGLSSKKVKTEYLTNPNTNSSLTGGTTNSYVAEVYFNEREIGHDVEKGFTKEFMDQVYHNGIFTLKDYGENAPLIILDGKVVESTKIFKEKELEFFISLDPDEAVSLYGDRAKNGAMVFESNDIKKVIGKVTDESGTVLEGVTITIKDVDKGTITDNEGYFEIEFDIQYRVLKFSKIGYKTKEVNILGKSEIDVQLRELNKEERFFEGLPPKEESGNNKKIKSGDKGSKSRLLILDGKEIESMDEVDPDIIKSVTILNDGTEEYGERGKNGVVLIATKKYKDSDLMGYKATNNKIRIKGSNVDRDKKPIYVVDNKISNVNIEEYDPDSIENINVLKGDIATEKYGKYGKNGVVELTLKHNNGNKIPFYEGVNTPLYVVDGEIVDNIYDLDVESIKSMTVLKNKSASERFGIKGKNGVVLFTTNAEGEIKALDSNTKVDLKGTDGKNPPMFMLNGEEVDNIDDVDPESIESINVYKNEQAIEWYGEKGKNGVVFIATKKDFGLGGERIYKVQTVNEDSAFIKDEVVDENGGVELKADRTTIISVEGKDPTESYASTKGMVHVRNFDTGEMEYRKIPPESKEPTIYINGDRTSFKMDDINPEAIESVNVLKGDDAIAKYGKTAKNGAIEITMDVNKTFWKENSLEKKVAIREVKKRDFDTGALVTSLSLEDTENIPLIFIDGKTSTLNKLESMDVDKIESINVLQKVEAKKEFGEKGKNGAIKILTKK